ncbi:MraY family glycosyltransferase [Chitinophaga agri]|uniref:Glycosyltransferase family 4 protein n=1 Tax=Chitinophaga agri TaxID=2703787 RepID=A0A6B9Z8B5_9BACT|nr:glycosyltransferase family 4 protein [Chitinophaga agri]QHS58247.1 glycosyltransferase family 4 protein [Chitinophaga agri]
MIYLILFILFTGTLLIYFSIADRFNIIDKPNERSSHAAITIRGGGVVFIIAALTVWVLDPNFWLVVTGLLIIGGVSFADDIWTLPNRIRIVFHITAVTLMFLYLQVFASLPVYLISALYILVIGIINAYNFMDGINGITGLYSLVILAGLQYVNLRQVAFTAENLIWIPMLATGAFLVFNFRKKAVCFAGDVGSVTISFWIVTLLLQLIFATGNWLYILFLAVYGVDAVLTIIHRLILRQNIFKAHRLHFYQLLANECKVPHLVVSVLYAILQLLIICVIVGAYQADSSLLIAVCLLMPLAMIYIILKPRMMRAQIR